MAVKASQGFRLGPLYTPPSVVVPNVNRGTLIRPSVSGGANWSGAAVDPDTGILYVQSRSQVSSIGLELPRTDLEAKSNLRYMEARSGGPAMPQGLPLLKPPYSRMTAIDMNTGDHSFVVPLGNGDAIRNQPMLKGLKLPPLGGDSTMSGPLVTKTLLIGALTRGGRSGGPRLVARDKATGQEVASVDLPGMPIGTPMTYMLEGKQYIALTVGGQPVPELVAFALP
jgi:quinoprotein glucose dehydrogenase